MKNYLALGSLLLLLLLAACASPYKHLQFQKAHDNSALKYKPVFDKEEYRCIVDGKILFKKFHLSGVLFFKTLSNHKTRVIFQNEMGFTFFDFEWNANDSFRVVQILDKMNKPAVVKTLEKDLNLLLMKNLNDSSEVISQKDNTIYNRFTLDKGYVYYISKADSLNSIVNTGKRKKVTTIAIGRKETVHTMPDSVLFTHHKAHFTIKLNKIKANVNE